MGIPQCQQDGVADRYGTLQAFARPRKVWLNINASAPYESGGGDVLGLQIYAPGGILELLAPDDGDVRSLRST